MGTGGSGQYPEPHCHDPESALSHSSGQDSAAKTDPAVSTMASDPLPPPEFPSTPLFPQIGKLLTSLLPKQTQKNSSRYPNQPLSPSSYDGISGRRSCSQPRKPPQVKAQHHTPRFSSGPAKNHCQPPEPANPLSLMCKLFTFLPSKKDLTWCLLIFSNCRPFRT